jgi:predicted small lipoprotein YifL
MPVIALSLTAVVLCAALTGCARQEPLPPPPVAPSYEQRDLDQFDHLKSRQRNEPIPI